MADSELDILIRLLAETKGADQVQAALDRTKDLTGQTSKAGEDLNATTKEGTKEAEHYERAHEAVHKILHLIAHESGPQMGTAIATGAAAATGSVALLIVAVRELFEWIKVTQEKANEMRAEAADAQVAVFDAQRQAMVDAEQSAQSYLDVLHKIKSVSDVIKQDDSDRETLLKAQIDAAQKLLEFEEKRALLAANGNKQEEDRVKQIFEGKKQTADQAGDVAQIVQKRTELAELEMNLAAAQKRMADAQAAAAAGAPGADEAARASVEMKYLQTRTGTGENDLLQQLFKLTGLGKDSNVDTAKQRLKEMSQEAAEGSEGIPNPESGLMPENFAAVRYEAARKALDAVEKNEGQINALNKVVADHAAATKKLTDAQTRAQDEFNKLRDQAEATRAALKTAEELYGVKAGEARAEGQRPPSIPPVPGPGTAAPTAEEAFERIQRTQDALYAILNAGGQLDKSQTATMQQILQMQIGHRVANEKILETVRAIYQDAQRFQSAMDRELNSIRHARDQAGY